MEKLFHTSSSVKCPNLPISRQTKVIKKSNSNSNKNNYNTHTAESSTEQEAEKIIQNGIAKLLSSKTSHENQNIRKKSTPVVLNKKNMVKKSRHCVNENVIKNHEINEDSYTIEDQKLKALSEGDISCEKFNDELANDMKIKCKSQGVQTLNSDDVESIYSDGVIRF